jgi:hypothetical protein
MSLKTVEQTYADEAVGVFQAFDHLFTGAEAAIREFMRRREDTALTRETHAVLGAAAESLLARMELPTALLYRQIGTPTHEALLFLETAERLNLQPLIVEYLDDKFVGAGNPYKRALGKLPIFQHRGSDGRDMVRYVTRIDFNSFVGKKLSEACCISGMTLVDFHHDILQKVTDEDPGALCFDATNWFVAQGSTAVHYYDALMTLLVRDCIMFENYETSRHLSPFMHNVVIPSFERTETRFGLRPLIVRLLPPDEEDRPFWNSYPKFVADFVS